ncbi:GNAT family N-acetyltransferase [Actinoplanes derwentensis]|uniref:L-amino acid N-acyltransferase YncA n=1 Tax=Actinoplanes derwentensis TaxID=113562 RepID=A0A1H1PMN8_9ACTN|nr:GNAT family N-acetyltransferase [Actinoplanes derwentensis]GID90323.1 N-acetyltransferase [Actinoplanes derwentensis]SDS12436.1 L-amino acid N-acyltransferase YncA [Actinoplanes derwentensis]
MEIREATVADITGIVDIGHTTWPETYRFAGPDYIAHGLAGWWSPEAVARSLSTTTVLVATDDDGPIATGNIDLRGEVPIIWKLYVHPDVQSAGVGSALIRALLDLAPGRPVRLEHLDGNDRAARFYARHGFALLRREAADQAEWPDTIWLERPAS